MPESHDSSPTKGIRVLVVDDEPSVLEFIDRILREAGYSTVLASDGPEALEIGQKSGPFDLLLTDLMMPKMSGDELSRWLRRTEPTLKVLYLTGYSDRLFKERATLWEGEAFLDKPCTATGLLEAVSLQLFGRTKPTDQHTS